MAEKGYRYEWIDSFKGISILGVMLIHSGAMSNGGVIGKISSYGSAFVQAFFIMSSFLTWLSLSKYQHFSASNYKDWLLKKYGSLAPLYYIAMIVSLLILGGNQYWAGDASPKDFSCIITHLTFLHGLFPKYCNSIIGVEWYIGVLALFYLAAPFIFKIVNNLKRSVLFFLFTNLVSVGICVIVMNNNFGGMYSYIYDEYAYSYGLTAQLPTLSLGIVLYYMVDRYKSIENQNIRVIFPIICMLVAIIILYLLGRVASSLPVSPVSVPTIYGLAFASVLLGQSVHACRVFRNGLFAFIGRKSYGLYLFHYMFFLMYEQTIDSIVGSTLIDWAVRYVVVIVVTLCFSYILECIIKVLKNRCV